MIEFLRLILHIIASFFKPRTKLVAEILVLRQQLNVLRRTDIEATTTQQYRSLSVCLALSLVPFRPKRDCNSAARDDHPLASRGVPVVLARAVTQAGWQAENLGRAALSHRRDEPCKSPLGCTAHSW